MPGGWQLTKLDGQCIWYEYLKNSKIIMPEETDECQNLEEVELYVKKFNLPLVKIVCKTNNKGGKKFNYFKFIILNQ